MPKFSSQRFFIFFIFLGYLSISCTAQLIQRADKKDFVAEMDEAIPQWLDEFIVPGAVFAVIDEGELVLQKAYGFSDLEKETKVNLQTGFNVASISKTVTAWGVMKLVEEGKLELDVPAEQYLTRWKFPESEFDSKKITIRGLLSHTAGLSLHGYPGWTPDDRLSTIEESLNGRNNGPGAVKIVNDPNTEYQYSGGGYTVLQLIIEEVTGEKFEDYMQAEILNPLGMYNSSYRIDDEMMQKASKEHNRLGEVIPYELFTAQAAAGLQTSIEDFVKFSYYSLYNSNSKQKVLKKSTIESMNQAVPASQQKYGLGYIVYAIPFSEIIINGHGGSNSGWKAIFYIEQESKNAFVMFTNSGNGNLVYQQAFCKWAKWAYDIDLVEECQKSIAPFLFKTYQSKGIDEVISSYKNLKAKNGGEYNIVEDNLNNFGYELLGKNKLEDAIAVFKLNMEEYPDSWNVYDSLGEAYMIKGDKELSIKFYKKSLEINPKNQYGIDALKKLEGK